VEIKMKFWEENIRRVTPYTPGEQPKISDMIKLNTNECPYPPSPMVEQAIKSMDSDKLRLYPDPEAAKLVDALAEYYNVNSNQVFVGVGSDDVLGMAFLTFFNSAKPILIADITYSFYDVWADLFRIPFKSIPLNDKFKIEPDDYKKDNGGIVIPNPNAPTAIELPLASIEDIVKNNQDVVVIIDEAYIDFGGQSALSLVDKYENLLVVQTFSKSRAMAGMRIGFAIGSEKLISAMKAVKFSYNSYTMNQTAIVSGVASIKDDTYFKETVAKIIKTREEAKEKLAELGFETTDSKANFLFATHRVAPAQEIFEKLKEKHIFVRYFKKPRIDNYLRITIGTDEEMRRLYEALEDILSQY
jgi:histidinol-phosphate aminotransferase